MCTVTYVPSGNGFFITSNRDEKIIRQTALQPAIYHDQGEPLMYPKDAQAGGTWIAAAGNGNLAVLLNGAFVKHIARPPYRRSRGLVFLDLIAAAHPFDHFIQSDLADIEPMTIVLFAGQTLYECRWDGLKKHSRLLDQQQPHIWSSATLYDETIVATRASWFRNWLQSHPRPNQEDILNFHRFGGADDPENDLLMNRGNTMLTVSITGMEWRPGKTVMQYFDLQKHHISSMELRFSGVTGREQTLFPQAYGLLASAT